MFARKCSSFDFAFGAAFAKSAWYQNRMEPLQVGRWIFFIENLCIYPFHIHLHTVCHAAVRQGLGNGFIRILKLCIFPNNGNFDFTFWVVNAVCHVVPAH